MTCGRLIVIEGLDGIGKTTASKALAVQLGAHWVTTPSAALRLAVPAIRDAYRTANGLVLFYASSVIDLAGEVEEVLASGQDVVCDRYWLSTLSGAAVRGANVSLDALELAVRPADYTILLVADDSVRARRLFARERVTDTDRASLEASWSSPALNAMRCGLRRPVSGQGFEIEASDLEPVQVLEAIVGVLGESSPDRSGVYRRLSVEGSAGVSSSMAS